MANSLEQQVRALVRDVPDFPKPGILFRDLTPVMRDPQAWKQVMEGMQQALAPLQPEVIVGIEARGFIVGTGLAMTMGLGFVPVRKPGKLLARLRRWTMPSSTAATGWRSKRGP